VAGARDLNEYSNKANSLIQSRQWGELEKLMRQGIRDFPDKEWMHSTLNYALREQKKHKEAVEQGREMRRNWPDTEKSANTLSRALTSAASAAYYDGNFAGCLELAEEARQLDQSESSYVWSGNALRKLERFQESARVQEEGLTKYPTNPWLKPNLAATYAAWGKEAEDAQDYDPAIERYIRAHELDPDQSYVLFRLGRAYRAAGKFEEAIKTFKKGRDTFPDAQEFTRAIGYTQLLRFRSVKETASKKELENLAELALQDALKEKDFQSAEYLVTLIGEAYTQTRNADDLRKAMKSMERVFSDPVPLWDSYGRQLYILHRRQGPVPAAAKEESLSYRRKAMSEYERKHPGRPLITNLPLPLKNRFVVWAEFDGDYMTHTGFAKYCYDFARVDASGQPLRPGGKRLQAADYWMFGEPVYSMTEGKVVSVVTDQPDNNGGEYGSQGNSVTVETEDGYYAFYTHFKKDSISVKEGQNVRAGTKLGLAGNSGMSTEPHLHVCLYDSEWVSLPFRFTPIRIKSPEGSKLTSDPLRQGWIVEAGG
tara:strand:+ start:8690 stop:10309 length:1620 start_codon:yes stop_codon:yes gene_type:complete